MARKKKIRVKMKRDDSDTAYIALPGYPDQAQYGIVSKTICLDDVLDGFKGPRVHLDFNKDGLLIGIEILVFGQGIDPEPDPAE
jgi:Protein of unknown function (DUF2283)